MEKKVLKSVKNKKKFCVKFCNYYASQNTFQQTYSSQKT